MTYQSDPTRWTHSHGDAPELLRGAFDAGTREGPSDLQMRALALKLAAVGGGAALAAGASTAHASATAGGGALAAAGASTAATLTKLAVSLAIVGAAATGAVLWQRGSDARPSVQPGAQHHVVEQAALPNLAAPLSEARVAPAAPVGAALGQAPTVSAAAPTVAVVPAASARAEAAAAPTVAQDDARAESPVAESDDSVAGTSRAARSARRHERRAAPREEIALVSPNATKSGEKVAVERVTGQAKQQSEIDLLRSARAALASRPREAFQLTEQHRNLYPQGVFTQERDALAVEALLRTGDLKLARQLAEVFVKRYPSSPHAHRFREAMQLP